MRMQCFAFLIALSLATPVLAQTRSETVFVGELRSITMTRRDYEAEERAERGSNRIVISNSCGTAETTFRVVHASGRLPRDVRTTSTIGEWCDPPLAFGQDTWLVVMNSRTRELLASYEIVEQQGASFALVLDSDGELSQRPAEVREMLALESLPEPIEYNTNGFVQQERLANWISTRPALELREGKAWIVRAVPIARLFPAN
jgi:hypothetical protein